MRTGIVAGLLLLILVVFAPRSRDEGPTPGGPRPERDGSSPVAPAIPETDTPASIPVPDGAGRLRLRFVTGAEEDAPPVPEAVATVYRREFEDWVEVGRVVADEDGWADFGGWSTGYGSLSQCEGIARAEGRAGVWFRIPSPGLAALLPWGNVVVMPRPKPLSGRILDAVTGRPVAGARVETRDWSGHIDRYQYDLTPGPMLDRTETGADGGFELPSRVKLMQVTADGYATARKSIGQTDGEVTIRLSPGVALAGRVTDVEGRPVAGATVLACPTLASTHRDRPPTKWRFRAGNRRPWAHLGGTGEDLFSADRAKTDADGRYRIEGLTAREEHYVWVLVDGKPRTWLTVVRPDGAPCDLRFVRLATLTVRMARPDRKGVLVTLTSRGDLGWEFSSGNDTGEAVKVVGIIPGVYDVCVVPKRYRNRRFVVMLAPGADATREVPEKEEEAEVTPVYVTVTGAVVDDRGAPVVEAWVSCEGADKQDKLTDAGGGFWFRKPVSRFPEMAAEAEGYLTARISGWWINGSKPVRFVLHRRVLVRIPLRVPDAAALPKKVRLVIRDPRGSSLKNVKVEAGRLVVPVPADTTLIRLKPVDFLPVDLPMPGGEGAERETAPLTLDPGAAIRFLVVDPDGRPIPGASVDVRQRGNRHCRGGTTDAAGRVTVPGLFPEESARAIVFARSFAAVTRTGLAPGTEPLVEVRLAGWVELVGRVVYDDGHPAGAVRVAAYRFVEGRDEEYEGFAYTDNAGRFRITVAPGEYRLAFTPPTGTKKSEEVERSVVIRADGKNEHAFEIPRPR